MQLMDARAAAAIIKDGDTVALSGVVSLVVADAVLRAIGERFLVEGTPRDLTIICPCRAGWQAGGELTGIEHLAHPGLVSRILSSSFSPADSPHFMQLVANGTIDAYIFPMGILFRWLRECTAGSPGLLTTVGLGSFLDPSAVNAGASRVISINENDRGIDLVHRIKIDGSECLFIRSLKINVAIIKGSVADTNGNVRMWDEPIDGGVLHMAMAARAAGGRVIVEVSKLTKHGSLPARKVKVPAAFIDAVVVDPKAQPSVLGLVPSFSGAIRIPYPPLTKLTMGAQKIILRRALFELQNGDIVNLGFGMGSMLPGLARDEGVIDGLTFSLEHGAFGGIPAEGFPGNAGAFGAHFNPDAILDSTEIFEFYHGGGLNATLLGFAQIDGAGRINVGRYNGLIRGPGGYVDITHSTAKVLLVGTLTSGGLKLKVDSGAKGARELRIVQEGKIRKMCATVENVDFDSQLALRRGQLVRIITERAVFDSGPNGLVLVEVAPGIDIERDIIPQVDFVFQVSPALCEMPSAIFEETLMGLQLPSRH